MLAAKRRALRSSLRTYRRSAIAFAVYLPCFKAFRLPRGAPLPGAPPCIRQRFLPVTGGKRHGCPLRVFALHRDFGFVFDRLLDIRVSRILLDLNLSLML